MECLEDLEGLKGLTTPFLQNSIRFGGFGGFGRFGGFRGFGGFEGFDNTLYSKLYSPILLVTFEL